MTNLSNQIYQLINEPVKLDDLEETAIKYVFIENSSFMPGYRFWDGWIFREIIVNSLDDVLTSVQYATCLKARQLVSKIIQKKEWDKVFGLWLNTRVEMQIYLREFDNICDDKKWDCFIEMYQATDFGFEMLKGHYKKIFNYAHLSKTRAKRLSILKTVESISKNKKLIIYHGENFERPVFDYYSWTLSVDVAKYFAYRWGAGAVHSIEIDFNQAIDFLSESCDVMSGEAEVLFDGKDTILKGEDIILRRGK